jgi:hypothetical protein
MARHRPARHVVRAPRHDQPKLVKTQISCDRMWLHQSRLRTNENTETGGEHKNCRDANAAARDTRHFLRSPHRISGKEYTGEKRLKTLQYARKWTRDKRDMGERRRRRKEEIGTRERMYTQCVKNVDTTETRLETRLETRWRHVGDTLETRWKHVGNTLETRWRHVGDTLESREARTVYPKTRRFPSLRGAEWKKGTERTHAHSIQVFFFKKRRVHSQKADRCR